LEGIGRGLVEVLKTKAILVTDRGGSYGCEMSRIPHYLDNLLTNGGEVVGLTHRRLSTPQKHFFASGTSPHFPGRT
jgi:hypothetical protein